MLEIAIEGRVVGTVLRGGSRVTHGVREIGKKKSAFILGSEDPVCVLPDMLMSREFHI